MNSRNIWASINQVLGVIDDASSKISVAECWWSDMKPRISGGLVHEMPEDLAIALTEKDVIASWEGLSAIGRNEYICWIQDAKQDKTRVKRIQRAGEEISEGKKRPCCWAGCIHRTDKKPSKWQQDVLIDGKSKPGET